ncbi:hypothetical protein GCM10010193_00990 [Kitasatospora atroaurantiaca]
MPAEAVAWTAVMSRIPLICPRCGHPQRVIPGGPEHPVRVVHAETGREECEPADTRPESLPTPDSRGT